MRGGLGLVEMEVEVVGFDAEDIEDEEGADDGEEGGPEAVFAGEDVTPWEDGGASDPAAPANADGVFGGGENGDDEAEDGPEGEDAEDVGFEGIGYAGWFG